MSRLPRCCATSRALSRAHCAGTGAATYNALVIDYDDPTQRDEDDHQYENVDEEEIRDFGGSLRVAVWIISAPIAVVMVAFPVMRVVDWGGDDDDSVSSASNARAFVATRFAQSALARRSTDEASRWAIPSLHDEIESIVAELRRRPAAELAGATVSVARVECDTPTGPDSECFHAWLRRPVASDFIRILFVVGIENGDAVVVEIERVNVV